MLIIDKNHRATVQEYSHYELRLFWMLRVCYTSDSRPAIVKIGDVDFWICPISKHICAEVQVIPVIHNHTIMIHMHLCPKLYRLQLIPQLKHVSLWLVFLNENSLSLTSWCVAHFSFTPGERMLFSEGATWKYATSVHTWYHHWRSPENNVWGQGSEF